MRAITLLSIGAALVSGASIASAHTMVKHTAPAAKLSLARAQAIALKAAPGTVVKHAYAKEHGTWRYAFDIKQKTAVREIAVDARTGKIVENEVEGKAGRG